MGGAGPTRWARAASRSSSARPACRGRRSARAATNSAAASDGRRSGIGAGGAHVKQARHCRALGPRGSRDAGRSSRLRWTSKARNSPPAVDARVRGRSAKVGQLLNAGGYRAGDTEDAGRSSHPDRMTSSNLSTIAGHVHDAAPPSSSGYQKRAVRAFRTPGAAGRAANPCPSRPRPRRPAGERIVWRV